GRPRCFDSTAASAGAAPRSLRAQEAGANIQNAPTFFRGKPNSPPPPFAPECGFWVGLERVHAPSRPPAPAHAAPPERYGLVGNSYSASMILAACLTPSSNLPFSAWMWRLTIGALRMCSNSCSCPGKFGCALDQVTFSALAARTAFHSFSATTASRSLIQTTL